jgi:hypothetical protein
MKTRSFPSFQALATELQRGAGGEFVHYWQNPSYANSLPEHFRKGLPAGWDLPGQSGYEHVPRYLFRGEPDVYPSTRPSRGRLKTDPRFTQRDLELLDELTDMAMWASNLRLADTGRALGWPQHYGFPTYYTDLTSDPSVALHFAAFAPGKPGPPQRAVYRIDLEAIVHKVYAPGGRETPLGASSIQHTDCTRADRQRAWVICGADSEAEEFDLQNCKHLGDHIEKFVVPATDAERFLKCDLLDASDDRFATWPLAVVRSMKAVIGGALPPAVAEWICDRIPLYDWTPVEVLYDGSGRGSRLTLLTPAQATQRFGQDFSADRRAVIEALLSAEVPAPNGIVYGVPTGGKPGTSRWLLPGDKCEVQWRYPFPGPPRWNGRAFETVILR